MDQIKSDRVRDLCTSIQTEQDQEKFVKLVDELNRLLDDEETEEHS